MLEEKSDNFCQVTKKTNTEYCRSSEQEIGKFWCFNSVLYKMDAHFFPPRRKAKPTFNDFKYPTNKMVELDSQQLLIMFAQILRAEDQRSHQKIVG